MPIVRVDREGRQIVMHASGALCRSTQEIVESKAFEHVLAAYLARLRAHRSPLLARLGIDGLAEGRADARRVLLELLRLLTNNPLERVRDVADAHGSAALDQRGALHELVEGLYDYWRSYDRFMVAHDQDGAASLRRPHREFNQTTETFAMLVRGLYRDVVENITGDHPRVYRQVSAGCEVGLVVGHREWPVPDSYRATLASIPFVRHVVIDPPFITDPPTNKRTGQFVEVDDNPVAGLELDPARWICYPAVVGPAIVFVYVNQRFVALGSALANLFEVADEDQIAAGPDAVYLFGVPPETLAKYGDLPTVFHADREAGLLVAAVPCEDRFGYFGYLKKMILTLHNVAVLDAGRMPYHGAFTRIVLETGAAANVLIIGDTAAGKSETLEALRELAGDEISELRIVADDMGSLALTAERRVLAYGTEIGAFVRLDDLSQGYAFEQLDRAIFMSPQKVNARVVVPVTTLDEVLHGYPVDILLYANNYEWVDESHPVVEALPDVETALAVLREGWAMSKGTTTSTGLTSTYFVNIFGATQRREQHEVIARRMFEAIYSSGTFVGQLRTRLGIDGYETRGPQEAAVALLRLIASRSAEGGVDHEGAEGVQGLHRSRERDRPGDRGRHRRGFRGGRRLVRGRPADAVDRCDLRSAGLLGAVLHNQWIDGQDKDGSPISRQGRGDAHQGRSAWPRVVQDAHTGRVAQVEVGAAGYDDANLVESMLKEPDVPHKEGATRQDEIPLVKAAHAVAAAPSHQHTDGDAPGTLSDTRGLLRAHRPRLLRLPQP